MVSAAKSAQRNQVTTERDASKKHTSTLTPIEGKTRLRGKGVDESGEPLTLRVQGDEIF